MWLRTWKGLDQGAHPPKGSFKLVLDIYKGHLPPLKAFHSIIIIRHPTKKSNSQSKAIPRSSPNTPITMVNPLYVVYVLSAMTGVQACKRTCSATGDSGGTCTYNCTHVCSSISANEARNTFLAALQNGGNSCSAVGTSGVKCRKTASFGSCYNHYWSCGSGC